MKTVYTCFSTDVIHDGHRNIIQHALKYGRVIVGCLSDKEMVRCTKFPTKTIDERIALYRSIAGIDEVVIQDDMLYDDVIEKLRPDYVVHGDNWKDGAEKAVRKHVEKLLGTYGGQIIDVPYTYSETVKKVDDRLRERLCMPEFRRKRLRQLIEMTPVVKAMEAHSGLTGLIVEKTVVEDMDGRLDQFDAMWVSSLCDSTDRGKPDIELVDLTSRLRTINDIMEVTTKPIILDGDTGGLTEHFVYNVRTLERMGVSAIIIEDKTGLKKNSLFGTEVVQSQDTIENFSAKIAAGKKISLKADVSPKNAANPKIKWQTNNKRYAAVNSRGVVTTKKAGKGKTVTIKAMATDGSKVKASYKIKLMKHAVTKVKIKKAPKNLKAGKSILLKTTVQTNGKNVNKALKWSTSNKKYASVDSKGKVKTKKAGKGKTVTITATATDGSNKKASVRLKIK